MASKSKRARARKVPTAASYRAVFTADLHLSNTLSYAKPGDYGITDRFQDELNVLEEMKSYAIANDIKDVYILGDLFDKHLLDAITLRETTRALVSMHPLNVHILPGNHDAHGQKGHHFTSEMYEVMDKPHIRYMGDGRHGIPGIEWLHLWAVGYKPTEDAESTINRLRELASEFEPTTAKDSTNYHVLFLHQSIMGCTSGGWICDDGLDFEELRAGWDCIMAGHFHDPQGVYLGAPLQHHFGDVGSARGFWDVTFVNNPDGLSVDFLKIIPKAPKFYKVEGIKIPKGVTEGDYVRFIVKATPAEWAHKKSIVESALNKAKEKGINAQLLYKPIHHHSKRLASDVDKIDLEKMISDFAESRADEEGLDVEVLKKAGYQAIAQVRRESGVCTGVKV